MERSKITEALEYISYLNSHFGLFNGKFYNEIEFYESTRKIEDDNFCFFAGVTRGVVIPEDANFVIKFDLYKESYVLNNYSPCRKEAQNYLKLKEKELDWIVAPVEYGFTFNNIDFYLQEKCYVNEDINESILYDFYSSSYTAADLPEGVDFEDKEKVEDYFASLVCDPTITDILLGIFKLDYCDDILKVFYELEINDLHTGNFGITKSGDPVIFDYAGYFGGR